MLVYIKTGKTYILFNTNNKTVQKLVLSKRHLIFVVVVSSSSKRGNGGIGLTADLWLGTCFIELGNSTCSLPVKRSKQCSTMRNKDEQATWYQNALKSKCTHGTKW